MSVFADTYLILAFRDYFHWQINTLMKVEHLWDKHFIETEKHVDQ